MGRRLVPMCRDCGREIIPAGRRSRRCRDCAVVAATIAERQMREKRGLLYRKWLAAGGAEGGRAHRGGVPGHASDASEDREVAG